MQSFFKFINLIGTAKSDALECKRIKNSKATMAIFYKEEEEEEEEERKKERKKEKRKRRGKGQQKSLTRHYVRDSADPTIHNS